MISNSLISKYEKLEKSMLEIKKNFNLNVVNKIKKINLIKLIDSNFRSLLKFVMPAAEEEKENSKDLEHNQAPLEFPESEEGEEDLEKKKNSRNEEER